MTKRSKCMGEFFDPACFSKG